MRIALHLLLGMDLECTTSLRIILIVACYSDLLEQFALVRKPLRNLLLFAVLLAVRAGELKRGGCARMKPTLFTNVGQQRD
jgi:hypothetical protein